MHQNGRGTKQGDRLLKMQGKLDCGPVEFKSHIAEQDGEIMAIATRDVIAAPPTQSIIGAVEQMTTCGFRRLPVTDPGTGKLRESLPRATLSISWEVATSTGSCRSGTTAT